MPYGSIPDYTCLIYGIVHILLCIFLLIVLTIYINKHKKGLDIFVLLSSLYLFAIPLYISSYLCSGIFCFNISAQFLILTSFICIPVLFFTFFGSIKRLIN